MILDELQSLLKSMMDFADQFSDETSEWLLIEHRLQTIRENFQFLFAKTNREHRELRVISFDKRSHIISFILFPLSRAISFTLKIYNMQC